MDDPLFTRVVVDLFKIGYTAERKWRQLVNRYVKKAGVGTHSMDKLRRKYQAIQNMG